MSMFGLGIPTHGVMAAPETGSLEMWSQGLYSQTGAFEGKFNETRIVEHHCLKGSSKVRSISRPYSGHLQQVQVRWRLPQEWSSGLKLSRECQTHPGKVFGLIKTPGYSHSRMHVAAGQHDEAGLMLLRARTWQQAWNLRLVWSITQQFVETFSTYLFDFIKSHDGAGFSCRKTQVVACFDFAVGLKNVPCESYFSNQINVWPATLFQD